MELDALAAWVAELRAPTLPAAVLDDAIAVFADTVGVVVAGAEAPLATRVGWDGPGHATVLRARFPRAPVDSAILHNTVAACGSELDEWVEPTGHPAAHLVPALLALSQEWRSTGADFLAALIGGYEVHVRVQRAVGLPRPPVHCHANVGHAGVAAGLARLAGMSAEQTRSMIDVAAGLACATTYGATVEGATAHAAAPWVSAQVAQLAYRLVRAGFTGYSRAVPEVLGAILGTGFAAEQLAAGLGEGFAIGQGAVKFYACCAGAHPALEAVLDALDATGGEAGRLGAAPLAVPFAAEEIDRVELRVGPRAAALRALPPAPFSPAAARFSLPCCVAALLHHGRLAPDAFDAPDVAGLARIAERVEVVHRLGLDRDGVARAVVVLADGRRWEGHCAAPLGTPARPAGRAAREARYLELTRPLGTSVSRALGEACRGVGQIEDMRFFPWRPHDGGSSA